MAYALAQYLATIQTNLKGKLNLQTHFFGFKIQKMKKIKWTDKKLNEELMQMV